MNAELARHASGKYRRELIDKGVIRVLVVDDSPADFELLRARLSRVPEPRYEVTHAADFESGLAGMHDPRYDAFVIDIGLGSSDGIELIRLGREVSAEIPMIILTGRNDREIDLEAMRAGATDFINKDTAPARLVERILRYSVERHRARSEARWLARHDPLTGLLNRDAMREYLRRAMGRARRGGSRMGLLYLNVVGFRAVRAEVGHEAGEELLRGIGLRLSRIARPQDVIARLGGDEFMLMLDELDDADEANHVARQLARSMAEPFVVGDRRVVLDVPIGAVIYPGDGEELDTLVLHADHAMSRAREEDSRVAFWSMGQQMRYRSTRELMRSLDGAVERGDFLIHYQPVFVTTDGRLAGFESLLRWQHLDHGLVTPREFIAVLERSDRIHDVGAWVLDQTCALLARCRRDTGAHLRASVNLSARELLHVALPERIGATLERYDLPGRMLQIDIAESAVADRLAATEPAIDEIRQLGVRVALDGFGRSDATLGVLETLRLDAVKLGESRTRGLGSSRRKAAVIGAVVELWHALGAEVWADAVEGKRDLAALQRVGCDFVQGYLFGGAGSADRIVELASRQAGARRDASRRPR